MASFYDSDFGDDGGGPGPTWEEINGRLTDYYQPEDLNRTMWQDMNSAITDFFPYNKTGEGDSFKGEDPSVFDGEGDFVDEQSADTPSGGVSFGRNDDPDTVENPGDVEYGSNEYDIPKPEEVISTTDLGEDEPNWLIEASRELFDETDWLEYNTSVWSDVLYPEAEEELKELQKQLEDYEAEYIFETIRSLRDSLARDIKLAESDFRISLLNEAIDLQLEKSDELLFGAMLYFNEGPPSKNDVLDFLDIPNRQEVLDFLGFPTNREIDDFFSLTTLDEFFGVSNLIEFIKSAFVEEESDLFSRLTNEDISLFFAGMYDIEDLYGVAEARGSLDIETYVGDVDLFSLIEEFSYNEPDDLYY